MFNAIVTGKVSSVQLSYNAGESLFEALVLRIGEEKTETKRIQDTDLNLLFKQVRAAAGDRVALLSFRKFSREMQLGIKMLNQQRRAFLLGSKKEILAIRAVMAKQRAAKKKAKASSDDKLTKTVGKKVVKKSVKK